MVRIGTSGFSYKEWCGNFYPEKIAGPKMLAFYAGHFPTVEINYTFRAMPRRQMLEKWCGETPEGFRFALKAPERITHTARLRDVQKEVDYFVETAQVLGDRLGPTLFQLPPFFKKDLAVLRDFLALLNRRIKAAFEFRSKSWLEDDVYAALHEADCALCIAESDKLATPIVRTAEYGYLRLRKANYLEADLAGWAEQIKKLNTECSEVYVFLKHATGAPALVERLVALIDAGS
ncbi:MAG: DUF72 domain-containing protein [Candidatus Binataceae bacterium]